MLPRILALNEVGSPLNAGKTFTAYMPLMATFSVSPVIGGAELEAVSNVEQPVSKRQAKITTTIGTQDFKIVIDSIH